MERKTWITEFEQNTIFDEDSSGLVHFTFSHSFTSDDNLQIEVSMQGEISVLTFHFSLPIVSVLK